MKKNLTLKRSGLVMLILYFLTLLPFLNACRSESITNESETGTLLSKPSISMKKLNEVPEAVEFVDQLKNSSNNIFNKTIEGFEVDEDNVLVVDLQEQGKSISMVVQQPVLELDYSVINLNIVAHNGVESYFLTKYIPADGKPFYNFSNFVGTIQYLDLNGNILSSSSHLKNEHIAFTIGCYDYVIQDYGGGGVWNIENVSCHCNGGSGTGGTTGGNNGGTQGGSNGGYIPGAGGGGGGVIGGTSSQSNIPNIPTEDVVDQKRYKNFLLTRLSQDEVNILLANQNLSDHIFHYQKNKNFSPASWNNSKWFMNFYGQTRDAEPFSYFDAGTRFIDENTDIVNPNNVFLRIYALDKFIKQNPDGLLDIPCSQLPQWQDISKYQIPQSVKNKINSIPNQNSYWSSWDMTNLDDGAGARVNMDLFPVKITTMPNKPNGQKYTATEFFDFFRKNINLFAETFKPIEDNYYNIHDTALWNSSNPLGALISIDIRPDDGTVICSGFSSNTWIFTTIKAPLAWSYDGIHPVAGNRKFSYYTDPNDGSITIYTRGVDRLSNINSNNTPLLNFLIESTAFWAADQLWTGMQEKLSNYVNSHGGNSTKVTPEKFRPKYEGIDDYLKGKSLITSFGCK